MSEFHVEVIRIGLVEKHPNADLLSITQVHGGYPVIFKTGDFREGDLATYIPIDSVVPDSPEFSFLKHRRIKAMRLRGVFSMGLLIPAPEGSKEGDNVQETFGITKYEPEMERTMILSGEDEQSPQGWFFPHYTDLDGLRRYPNVLKEGEEVIFTEKIHGANARYIHDGERLWVGSRTRVKRDNPRSAWWNVARSENMKEKLSQFPNHVFFGEIYGQVQDLKYGRSDIGFLAFDVFDIVKGRYLDHDVAVKMVEKVGLTWVPILYRGPWNRELANERRKETASWLVTSEKGLSSSLFRNDGRGVE